MCLPLVWLCLFSLLFYAFALTSSSYFLWGSCFHLVPVCFAGTVLYSYLKFFCRPSRLPSRVVLSSFSEWKSGLGLLSSVLRWGLWTLLLALGRFVLLSLSGPLTVQLRFSSACGSDRTLEFPLCEEVSGGSAGCSDPGTFCWCCGTLSLPCWSLWPISLWALGRGFLFCLSFLHLRFPFYGLF